MSPKVGGHVPTLSDLTASSNRIIIDWAKTKDITVLLDGKIESFQKDELVARIPPPHSLYIEGVPGIERDKLIDLGYDVFYCRTTIGAELRRESGKTKSDKVDVRVLASPKVEWFKAVRTEPLVVEIRGILRQREVALAHSKLNKQLSKSLTYMTTSHVIEKLEEDSAEIVRDCSRKLVAICRRAGLHALHKNIYGVQCLTVLSVVDTRPWTYKHGLPGWKHANGFAAANWSEYAQRRSKGCDTRLKTILYGSVMTTLIKTSPDRPLYDSLKASLPETIKSGRVGHGKYKVTPHAKALNRIFTQKAERLFGIVMGWHRGGGLSDDLYGVLHRWFSDERHAWRTSDELPSLVQNNELTVLAGGMVPKK